MTVEVTLSGNGKYAGAKSSIVDYTVSEEASPLDAADSSGAVLQVGFNAVDDPSYRGSQILLESGLSLYDDQRGTAVGTITGLSANGGFVNITAMGRLSKLVTNSSANAFNGTFSAAITYYLGLGGITTDISVDASLASQTVVAPGWRDADLWTKIKELCVVYGAEITIVGSTVTVRPPRTRTVTSKNFGNTTWETGTGTPARNIEVFYYNSEYRTNYMIYPDGGFSLEDNVLTVDAGETTVVNLPVNMFLNSLEQPTVQDVVYGYYTGPSVYSVAGSDGYGIQAAQWTSRGGKLSVAIGADGRSIDVTITGATGDLAQYAPFRIASAAMDSSYYSSLMIRGTGVYNYQQSVVALTGEPETTSEEIGVTIDNIFVRSFADAWKIAMSAARRYTSPLLSVSRSGVSVELSSGTTLGSLTGSRFKYRRAMFRVKSTTVTGGSVDYSAEEDTTFGDFNAEASGMTFADFNTMYSGLTFGEFSKVPLPKVDNDNDRY